MYDIYALGATLAVILGGLLYNGKQIGDLRNEMRGETGSLRTEMRANRDELKADIRDMRAELVARFDTLQRDLTQFAREQGKHDARLDALERGRTS
jgi:Tfp pilus assembly protein FimV